LIPKGQEALHRFSLHVSLVAEVPAQAAALVLWQRLTEYLEDFSRHGCRPPASFQFGNVAALIEDAFPSLNEILVGLSEVLLQHFRDPCI
jgi:hypothetical protein